MVIYLVLGNSKIDFLKVILPSASPIILKQRLPVVLEVKVCRAPLLALLVDLVEYGLYDQLGGCPGIHKLASRATGQLTKPVNNKLIIYNFLIV